jgi:hypothetical protein
LGEEDLIDMSAGETRGTVRESGFAPLALAVADKDVTCNEVSIAEE